MNPLLQFEGVSKRYGRRVVLRDFSLIVNSGEILVLFGPSGAGKSTILKLILGLVAPDEGRILLHGKDITTSPVHLRRVGMVFQDYSLFPDMTVEENVAFALLSREVRTLRSVLRWRLLGEERPESKRMVSEMLELVRLEQHARKKPHQLSGGEQQRVAIARALIAKPELLCLDEPFSALDSGLRRALQNELKALQQKFGTTMIFVTHHPQEAMLLGHRIAVLQDGVIAQRGTPQEVYESPQTPFIAQNLGECNIYAVRDRNPDPINRDRWAIHIDGGLVVQMSASDIRDRAYVGIRPEHVVIDAQKSATQSGGWGGSVRGIDYVGTLRRIEVQLDAGLVIVALVPVFSGRIGDRVFVSYDESRAFLLRGDS